jgi:glutaredoxin
VVTVYGAHWCGPCTMVKKFLDDNNIAYDYVDIDKNPEAMPEGYMSIPVIEVDGKYFVGYNKELLTSLANQDLQ